jgi:hypothetical protein
MPELTVPKRYASGFARIISLSSAESDQIERALALAKSTNPKELTDIVVAALPSLAWDDAKGMVEALLSLYSARTGQDVTIDAFVAALVEAVPQAEIKGPNGSGVQPLEVITTTLRNLLSIRPLSMIAKARNLHIDHENTFCAARILTDLRAVFDVDVTEAPAGFVMAHILKLGYHHAGEHTELHVAMDQRDVDKLLVALQRAKLKAATLTTISNKSGFSILAD